MKTIEVTFKVTVKVPDKTDTQSADGIDLVTSRAKAALSSRRGKYRTSVEDLTAKAKTVERLTKLAEEKGITPQEVAELVGFARNRAGGHSLRDIIDLAIDEGDDPEWLRDSFREWHGKYEPDEGEVRLELTKSYSHRTGGGSRQVSGYIDLPAADVERFKRAMADRRVSSCDPRIVWDEEVEEGWEYEDWSFGITGEGE
jgi:hypothetical protein